jgi:hypothetical protein
VCLIHDEVSIPAGKCKLFRLRSSSIAPQAIPVKHFREPPKKGYFVPLYRRAYLTKLVFQPLVDSSERLRSAPPSLRLSEIIQLTRETQSLEIIRMISIRNHLQEALALAEYYKEPEVLKAKIRELSDEQVVSKGVVSKSLYIAKAWWNDGKTFIEGWISTEDRDTEKDIVPPECFLDSMKGYFDRRAPLSSNHAMKSYPVGHLQKSILVRDGNVLASFSHPTDPADFEHFPSVGTGWYARGRVTDLDAAKSVTDGNVGAFSWVGKVSKATPLPDGGHKFIEVSPLLEATIAAYPINPQAQITHVGIH